MCPDAIPPFPRPTPSPYIIIPHGIAPIPSPTIPPTSFPSHPHTIPTHTITPHHHPYTNPHTPPPSYLCPHTIGSQQGPGAAAPCGTCSASPGFSGQPTPIRALVSHRVPRGCREEGRPGAPDRVGAGGWNTGCTVPCLLPLSLLEGGTPCTGHQPLTQRDLG